MTDDYDFTYNILAGIPKTMEGVYLHEVQPLSESQEKLKTLLEGLKLKKFNTLLLLGDTGLGKTYMCQALANTMIYNAVDPERAALYTTHFEMELKLKDTMTKNYNGPSESDLITKYKTRSLLIIDEFGRGSVSEYFLNRFEYIVCERMMKDRRTIIITNKTAQELREVLDRQMLDRLGLIEGGKRNPATRRLAMNGESLRSHV
jgi:DNA replication protein DnaC